MTEPNQPATSSVASASIHAPLVDTSSFIAQASTFSLYGASTQHSLEVIREQDDDEESGVYSETRGKWSSMAHQKSRVEDIELPENTDPVFKAFVRIFSEQVEINWQLMSNKSASLPMQLPFFHGRANENVQTWLFHVDQIFRAKRIDTRQTVNHLVVCLKEAALHWYQNQVSLHVHGEPYRRFEHFAAAIKTAIQPPHYQYILRQ